MTQDKNFAEPVAEPRMERITVSFWDDHDQALAVMSIEADERGTFPALKWPAGVTRWRIERVKHA